MHLEHEGRTDGGSASQTGARRPSSSRARLELAPVRIPSARDARRPAALNARVRAVGEHTMTGELAVSSEHRADDLILSLSGELDLATSGLLERELDAAHASRAMRLIVDLSALEFIDSCGLKTLAKANQHATETGQQFSIRQGPRGVQRMFELIETAQPFHFDD
jgi:anti-sigma B factor antagonist